VGSSSFRRRRWWIEDGACSGRPAHRRVGDRACSTGRCECGGGVVVWWERDEHGSRVRAGSGGAGGLNRGLTGCLGGCSTLDSCESASGAGRRTASRDARFALFRAFFCYEERGVRAWLAAQAAPGQGPLGFAAQVGVPWSARRHSCAAFARAPHSETCIPGCVEHAWDVLGARM